MEYLNETRKEYGNEKGECRYGLQVSVSSCRRCLFETLCHLEKERDTLNNNANTNENATTEIIND